MVSASVLQQEMTVENLAESKHAQSLVKSVLLVDQFVACESIDAGHVTPDKCEKDKTAKSVRKFVFEKFAWQPAWVNSANHTHAPDPSQRVNSHIKIQRPHEALIVLPDFLAGLIEVSFMASFLSLVTKVREVHKVSEQEYPAQISFQKVIHKMLNHEGRTRQVKRKDILVKLDDHLADYGGWL